MSVEIRTAVDGDWPAISLVAATSFGAFRSKEVTDMWRTLIPEGGTVVACDGDDVVGVSFFLDLQLTVPGGAVLPMAGVSWVCVAPTHRRRGVLRALFGELHRRMGEANYPIAGLEASEGGIYSRFGYGPATIDHTVTIDRRHAQFHADVPDPGGVRLVVPKDRRAQLEEIYERKRLRTPGGLHTPSQLWDEVFADREAARHGGSALFVLLHDDGFAFYRVHGDQERKNVEITEMAALTSDAHIALWRTLLGMDLKDTITTRTYPGDPLPYLLTDARLAQPKAVEDGLWLRIIDIPTVLEARSYSADLTVVLDVSDRELGGGGRFALEVSNGKARCASTDANADVELDLAVLGSIYLGAHTASAYAAAHRLRSNDIGLIKQLDAAFASEVPAQIGYGF